MLRDALLLYLHISAILGLTVFLTAKTSHCRGNAIDRAALARMRRIDAWIWGSFAAVLLTGAALVAWGVKGSDWLLHNPLLWTKIALLGAMMAMAVPSTRRLAAWTRGAGGALPWVAPDAEVRRERRWLMLQSHLMVIVPLFATLLSHGFG